MTTYQITLNNSYANQEFDVAIDEIENSIHCLLQTVGNALLMSVFVNNEQLGQPFLCCANQAVIPYNYLQEVLGGNFIFETEADNYPNYENFGTTCNLFFVTLDEING